METPIAKVLNDRINRHKDRHFRQAINKLASNNTMEVILNKTLYGKEA